MVRLRAVRIAERSLALCFLRTSDCRALFRACAVLATVGYTSVWCCKIRRVTMPTADAFVNQSFDVNE